MIFLKKIKSTENVSLIILLSHNGVDVDKKLAKDVSGIDVILGGHTHDVLPLPVIVQNANSKTLVINATMLEKSIKPTITARTDVSFASQLLSPSVSAADPSITAT
mgnify:CR=1 FL=1